MEEQSLPAIQSRGAEKVAPPSFTCPDSFPEIDLLLLLQVKNSLTAENDCKTVQGKSCLKLTCGMVLKCYQGLNRLQKKLWLQSPHSNNCGSNSGDSSSSSSCNGFVSTESPLELDTFDYKSLDISYLLSVGTVAARLFVLVRYYTRIEDLVILEQCYHPRELYRTACELTKKLQSVSPKLVKSFMEHQLRERNIDGNLSFDHVFLHKLAKYHKSVERPEGTYAVATDSLVKQLASLPRELCPKCNKKCQLTCGECGGIRMRDAESLLPPRIALPYDILLLLHWHETLHKCTGIQAGALCKEGIVSSEDFPRQTRGGDIASIIASLDHTRDILLFPADSAVDANHFDWNFQVVNVSGSNGGNGGGGGIEEEVNSLLNSIHSMSINSDKRARHRIVVLEASWQHAKTMEMQIKEIRQELKLPEIKCIKLCGLVGKYWKFHREGNSAVSTIEAIAHLSEVVLQKQNEFALQNNITTGVIDVEGSIKSLLLLFFVQQYRVLNRVEEGGKLPQALEVAGTAEGSWRDVYKHIVIDGDNVGIERQVHEVRSESIAGGVSLYSSSSDNNSGIDKINEKGSCNNA